MMNLLYWCLVNVFAFWLSFWGSFIYSFCDTNLNPSEFCSSYIQSFDNARKQ